MDGRVSFGQLSWKTELGREVTSTARMSVIHRIEDGMDGPPIVKFEPCTVDSGEAFGQTSPVLMMMPSGSSDPLKGISHLKHPSHLPSPSGLSTPTSGHTSSRSTIFSRNFKRLGRNPSRRFHPWSSLVTTFFRSKSFKRHSATGSPVPASLPSPLPRLESNSMQVDIFPVGELNLGPAVSCLSTLSSSAERPPTLAPDCQEMDLAALREAWRVEWEQSTTRLASIASLTEIAFRIRWCRPPLSQKRREMRKSRKDYIKEHKSNLASLAARPESDSCSDQQQSENFTNPRSTHSRRGYRPEGLSELKSCLAAVYCPFSTAAEYEAETKKFHYLSSSELLIQTAGDNSLETARRNNESLERRENLLRNRISAILEEEVSRRLSLGEFKVVMLEAYQKYLLAIGLISV